MQIVKEQDSFYCFLLQTAKKKQNSCKNKDDESHKVKFLGNTAGLIYTKLGRCEILEIIQQIEEILPALDKIDTKMGLFVIIQAVETI